jgi:hypothetical protein
LKTRQGNARQEKTRHEKARRGKARQDKTKQHKARLGFGLDLRLDKLGLTWHGFAGEGKGYG